MALLQWHTNFGRLDRGVISSIKTKEIKMSQKTKRTFSAEFKLEAAKLVVDEKYSVQEAAKAMNVGLSTMDRWVRQLKNEREGISPKASPITSEQIEIRALKKEIKRINLENEILKKASALLMSDVWKNQF